MRSARPDVPGSVRPAFVAAMVALAAAHSVAAQPPGFSGASCSMTTCDCTCIAGEQRKGAEAAERLGVQLPSGLTRTLGRIPPLAALSRLQSLREDFRQLLLAIDYVGPSVPGAEAIVGLEAELAKFVREKALPDPPAGWQWDERYVRALVTQCQSEIERVEPLARNQEAIEREIQDCRNFAKARNCDASLQPPASTPPREQAPPPSVTTPPREMWPPAQPQPFGRHPDGRPYVDDELLTRYIAAKRAKDLEGGAYWRQGGFGQADFAEVERRVYDWVRTQGTQGRFELFDQAELDAFRHREKEVREAYTGTW